MQCPACSHEAPQAEFGEELKCPSCGAFYAKAMAAKNRQTTLVVEPTPTPVNTAPRPQPAKRQPEVQQVVVVDVQMRFTSMVLFMVKWTFAAIPALIIILCLSWFFVVMVGGLSSVSPPKLPASSSKTQHDEPENKSTGKVDVLLIDKGYSAGEYGRDEITFELVISNRTSKGIRAFDGELEFRDLLDNVVLGSKLTINDPLAANGSIPWSGKIGYNQFIARHERLKNEPLDNLKVKFKVGKILYEDGTTE